MSSPEDPTKKRRKQRPKRRKRKGSSTQDRAAVAAAGPRVDTARPADEPLTPAEVADMLRHLAFLRRYRTNLRLKFNAKEDLLVNGTREPSHRGACKHLMAKVDRGAIQSALQREPLMSDAKARVDFLAGAAAITGDTGVLLLFLQARAESADHEQAARAFTLALKHIHFDELSAPRVSQLLSVVETAFADHEVPGVFFGLLHQPAFRRVFDRHSEVLDAGVAERFVPLRRVHGRLSQKKGARGGGASSPQLNEGLRLMFSAPSGVLTAYAEDVRKRLLDLALASGADWVADSKGVVAVLDSLRGDRQTHARQGARLAELLVTHGDYKRAKGVLEGVSAKSGGKTTTEVLSHLKAPREGHFAMEDEGPPTGLRAAHSLRHRRQVWVRFGEETDAERFAREASIQQSIGLPGVADVLESGTTDKGVPFIAVEHGSQRLDLALATKRDLPLSTALSLALDGVRLVRALALTGVALPLGRRSRFLYTPGSHLVLADLDGATRPAPEIVAAASLDWALGWCRAALSWPPFSDRKLRREVPPALRAGLQQGPEAVTDLIALIELLRAAA